MCPIAVARAVPVPPEGDRFNLVALRQLGDLAGDEASGSRDDPNKTCLIGVCRVLLCVALWRGKSDGVERLGGRFHDLQAERAAHGPCRFRAQDWDGRDEDPVRQTNEEGYDEEDEEIKGLERLVSEGEHREQDWLRAGDDDDERQTCRKRCRPSRCAGHRRQPNGDPISQNVVSILGRSRRTDMGLQLLSWDAQHPNMVYRNVPKPCTHTPRYAQHFNTSTLQHNASPLLVRNIKQCPRYNWSNRPGVSIPNLTHMASYLRHLYSYPTQQLREEKVVHPSS